MSNGETKYVYERKWFSNLITRMPEELSSRIPRLYEPNTGKVKSPEIDKLRAALAAAQRETAEAEASGDIEREIAAAEDLRTVPLMLTSEMLRGCDQAEQDIANTEERLRAELVKASKLEEAALKALEQAEGAYWIAATSKRNVEHGINRMSDLRYKAQALREKVLLATQRIRRVVQGGMLNGMTPQERVASWRNIFALLDVAWWVVPKPSEYEIIDRQRNQALRSVVTMGPNGRVLGIELPKDAGGDK